MDRENLPLFPWSRSSLNLNSLRGCIPDHDQKSNVADSTEFNALFFSSLHAAIRRIMTHLGGKVVAEGGTNLRQRARHIMQPDPPAVQCSVRGGIGRRRRQAAAGPYAGPTPRHRRRRDPHSFRATLTKVKMKMSTRAAYTARKILKIHRQKMPLCCCRGTVIYMVRYCPRNKKIRMYCIADFCS